jgi:hypothetical protein
VRRRSRSGAESAGEVEAAHPHLAGEIVQGDGPAEVMLDVVAHGMLLAECEVAIPAAFAEPYMSVPAQGVHGKLGG